MYGLKVLPAFSGKNARPGDGDLSSLVAVGGDEASDWFTCCRHTGAIMA